mgnify:CR=1 FL=1
MKIMDRSYGAGGRHEYDRASARRWSVRELRAEFESLTPNQQAEKRQLVRDTLAAERARGQRTPSYLATIAAEVYGVEP